MSVLEIDIAGPDDLKSVKDILDQKTNGLDRGYDSNAGKIVIKRNGIVVAAVQYKPILFVESMNVDQRLPLLERALLFKRICVELVKKYHDVPVMWASKRDILVNGEKKDNRFVNHVYSTLGSLVSSINPRKRVIWKMGGF